MSVTDTDEVRSGAASHEDAVGARVRAAIAARKRAVDLLRAMKIERVLWIDDQHASTGSPESLDSVLEAAQDADLRPMLLDEVTKADFAIDDSVDGEDADEVSGWVRQHWEDFGSELQERLTLMRRRAGALDEGTPELDTDEREDDLNAIPVLDLFTDDAIEVLPLQLREWRRRRQGLLADGRPALILVDLDFTAEGFAANEGEGVLVDLLHLAPANVVAALLSHNLKSEDEERDYANRFAHRHSLSVGRVAAIGKFRQQSENSIPEALRALFLAEELESYRQLAAEAFTRAGERVQTRLNDLHRYTLLSSIDAGITEGSYELDVPLRILANEVRRELASATRLDIRAAKILERVRDSAARQAYVAAGTRNEQVHHILWEDGFDDPTDLNELNLPIEVGDMFEMFAVGPKSKRAERARRWVLLAQACDLSVRTDGTRSWELPTLTLTELVKAPAKPKPYMHELGRLDRDNTMWAVNVASRVVVPTKAIDATVFGLNGAAVLPSPSAAAPVATGWEARRLSANAKAESWVREYASAKRMLAGSSERGDKDLLARRIAASLTGAALKLADGVPVFVDEGAKTVTYGLRRFGRVTGQKASYLYSLAHGYQSRPASEADVASVPRV